MLDHLDDCLRELRVRRDLVDATIAQLIQLQGSLVHGEAEHLLRRGRKRGRKGMSAEQRKEVSRRMTKYWEGRRQQHEYDLETDIALGAPSTF